MNKKILIKNANIVNEGEIFQSSLLIEGESIKRISNEEQEADQVIDATGLYLLPGMIDDQVHFRDPGLTHKGDLFTESKAAVAGGITSFMEMPNTNPRTLTQELLEDKYQNATQKALPNYSFYMGTSNENLDEVFKTDPNSICGIKIFLGASTGNMLVDNQDTIREILKFSERTGLIVSVHSEDEETIKNNGKAFKEKYGDEVNVHHHPQIRSREACIKCTERILALAVETKANLHVLHISTGDETHMIAEAQKANPNITAEACVHHLWFHDKDYERRGNFIKWNPAIKAETDREQIRKAVNQEIISIVATDHAPHTAEEKAEKDYFKCPAGGPLVQHALTAMLEMYHQGVFSLETIVNRTAHNPATRFQVKDRGFIREGYFADLVLVDLNSPWTVEKSNILYKCGWSPFEDIEFKSKITHTFVNGNLVYDNGKFNENIKGRRLEFNRNPVLSH